MKKYILKSPNNIEKPVQEMYAYIIEEDIITEYDTCLVADWFEKHPEDEKWFNDNFTYIGSGYIVYYDYEGNLLQSKYLSLFYKRINKISIL